MIEIIIRKYLASQLDVSVYLEIPDKPAENYVLVEKTGSSKSNHILSATFAFQSYGKTMLETAQLNERVKDVVEGLITLDEIRKVELNSDYNYTDTTTKQYRYQAVFDIGHY
mgnify:CR=1 FL=1